ncbi:28665_t:CDS:2 [Dentiscutata erythropus]|uniref:28665_t:CDS:1 n=1 Tax=Dentiscutata erythropus TaxID=1348616 RepID=A0A9N9ABE4_9GLOM|nr:28665_t:CDS:2 [Dentiscutata erythropus]
MAFSRSLISELLMTDMDEDTVVYKDSNSNKRQKLLDSAKFIQQDQIKLRTLFNIVKNLDF